MIMSGMSVFLYYIVKTLREVSFYHQLPDYKVPSLPCNAGALKKVDKHDHNSRGEERAVWRGQGVASFGGPESAGPRGETGGDGTHGGQAASVNGVNLWYHPSHVMSKTVCMMLAAMMTTGNADFTTLLIHSGILQEIISPGRYTPKQCQWCRQKEGRRIGRTARASRFDQRTESDITVILKSG